MSRVRVSIELSPHGGLDFAAWSALYATRSRPFDTPATGKIAIKVINHYGDEVLKVCAVP